MGSRRNIGIVLVAAAMIGWLAFGLWRLFQLRFEAGDIYPPYSTRNAGPTGGKALFEALGRLADFDLEQNFVPLMRLENTGGATLVFAGAGEGFFGRDTAKNFTKFEEQLAQGTHVVATLSTASVPPWTDHEVDKAIEDLWRPGDLGLPGGDDDELPAARRWGFAFLRSVDKKVQPAQGWPAAWAEDASAAGEKAVAPEATAAATTADNPQSAPPAPGAKVRIPHSLPRWFSPWRLVIEDGAWKPLAVVNDKPVIIQRSFEKGSLTLVSDSTFLSNEALWRAPHPQFLLWLFGQRPRIIFDETHHGTRTDPGVMYLVRRYRLVGFFAGVAVLLALFVWQTSSSLVPASSSEAGHGRDRAGWSDATVGLRNFMKQNLGTRFLLAACFTEWAKSPLVRRKYTEAEVSAVRDIVHGTAARPARLIVKSYRAIADLLRRNI